MQNEEKELIDGYEVKNALWIGNSRVIYAKSEDPTVQKPYMKCIFRENSLFGKYEDAVISDNFENIMKLFADDIKAEAIALEVENRSRGDAIAPCLQKEDVIPFGSDADLHGKVVALKPTALDDGFKNLSNQLFLVLSGFGADANSRGTACFSVDLYSGKTFRVNRYELWESCPKRRFPISAKERLKFGQKRKTKERKDNGKNQDTQRVYSQKVGGSRVQGKEGYRQDFLAPGTSYSELQQKRFGRNL